MDAPTCTSDGQSTVGLLASGILTTASLVANGFQITAAQLANGFQATAAQFAQLAEQLRGVGASGPTAMSSTAGATLTLNGAGPYEQLIVRDSAGSGTVRSGIDGRIYFIMQTRIVDLFGCQEGSYEGVYYLRKFLPQDILAWPDPPAPPFDRPFRPPETGWDPVLNLTKARFQFANGELYTLGPGLSRIAPHRDDAPQFWFSTAGFITGGSGDFDGCIGQLTSLASTYFRSTPAPTEAVTFDVRIFHVLKILPRQDRAQAR
jgi:hypothetical protein